MTPTPPPGAQRLRRHLALAFAALAILPPLVMLSVQHRMREQVLTRTVGELASHQAAAIRASGDRVVDMALTSLDSSAAMLVAIGRTELARSGAALGRTTKDNLNQAGREIAAIGRDANRQAARDMVALNRDALARMRREVEAGDAATHKAAARAIGDFVRARVARQEAALGRSKEHFTRALAAELTEVGQAATRKHGERLSATLADEPLVDFRTIARVMARSFAGGERGETVGAHVTLVNRSGEVVASTRFKRGTRLRHLGLVRRALEDAPPLAAARPLVPYDEDGAPHIGVYERRSSGGAVVVGYDLALAEHDRARVVGLLGATLKDLSAGAERGAQQALEAGTRQFMEEVRGTAEATAREIAARTNAANAVAARDLEIQASRISAEAEARVAAQVDARARAVDRAIDARTAAVIKRATTEIDAVQAAAAAQAHAEMARKAATATTSIRAEVQPRIDATSREAAAALPAATRGVLDQLRTQALGIAALLLGLSLLAGLWASRWLSGRIADPIEVAERLREAELDRRGQELAIASRIQTALLPTSPRVPGFDVAVGMLPAAEVGGDLLDVLPTPDGGFWLAIGDVTGHGLTPGLIMMMAQSLFTGFVSADPTAAPKRVLTDLNRALHLNIRDRLRHDAFMTLMLLRHEGEGRFVAAGMHCDVLIHRAATGRVDAVEVEGCWTGLLPEVGELVVEQRFALEPGDTMLLYSDGLIEARNAEKAQFDTAGLVRTLQAAAEDDVQAAYQRIMGAVEAWQANRADDLSLLVLRRHASQPVPAGAHAPQVAHA